MIQIVTTTDDRSQAEAIADALIQRRLAACVQISGPVTSCYRWEDKIQRSEEYVCTIKTTKDSYLAVEAAIRELHSYEVPEIISVPVITGNPGYVKWVEESVA